MSSDSPVGPEGLIGFPFPGKVKTAGMTPREVERKLTTLLSDGYLKKPQVSVSVSVKEYGSQRVSGDRRDPQARALWPQRGPHAPRAVRVVGRDRDAGAR